MKNCDDLLLDLSNMQSVFVRYSTLDSLPTKHTMPTKTNLLISCLCVKMVIENSTEVGMHVESFTLRGLSIAHHVLR